MEMLWICFLRPNSSTKSYYRLKIKLSKPFTESVADNLIRLLGSVQVRWDKFRHKFLAIKVVTVNKS